MNGRVSAWTSILRLGVPSNPDSDLLRKRPYVIHDIPD
jgi:hypothetical protein